MNIDGATAQDINVIFLIVNSYNAKRRAMEVGNTLILFFVMRLRGNNDGMFNN
jgi:hypothetical protein